jgi:catechol 2,3-dioxygenase-like lactoylglutathione lyase family enzyme
MIARVPVRCQARAVCGRVRRGIVVDVLDHVTIRASDPAASTAFYATVLGTLGVEQTYDGDGDGLAEWANDFSLAPAAADDATVDAFHRAALDAGYRDNGAPDERAEYHAGYYAAYVLDPDGNNVEVVNHHR